MAGPAASCTIELRTGTRIYVGHDIESMTQKLREVEPTAWLELRPMVVSTPDPGWWPRVRADAVVAIYPLDQAPDAAQQREVAITLARPYELVSKIREAWRGRRP
jgi:hypothetical protein